jgi:hypothetical protein
MRSSTSSIASRAPMLLVGSERGDFIPSGSAAGPRGLAASRVPPASSSGLSDP